MHTVSAASVARIHTRVHKNGGGGGGGGEERVTAHPGCGLGGMIGLCFHSLTARCS